eukprot:COSAG01_NODE_2663_length_7293_cov_5.946483_1_plen_1241_part_00
MLLQAGANINAVDVDGMTPLMEAVPRANFHVITALLAAGADVTAVNRQDLTAAGLAGLHRHSDLTCDTCVLPMRGCFTPTGFVAKAPPGMYDAGRDCTVCPPGSITDTGQRAGAIACTLCTSGLFSSESNVSSCSYCMPGSVTNLLTSAGSSNCTACPAGRFSAVSTRACIDCPSGSVTDRLSAVGSSNCTACPAGRFSAVSTRACIDCPSGSVSDFVGSSNCTACPAGRFSSAATMCMACAVGRYIVRSAASNNYTCAGCPSGSVLNMLDQQGSTSCTACAPSRFSALPTSACADCVAGSITNTGSEPGATQCTLCTHGRYSPHSNVSQCSCLAATVGVPLCSGCPEGWLSSALNSAECSQCSPGYRRRPVWHWAVIGRPNRVSGTPSQTEAVCADPDAVYSVRCCGDGSGQIQLGHSDFWCNSSVYGSTSVGCASLSFRAAQQHCQANGLRLCTREEVEAGCTASTGCSFDFAWVHTSTPCSPNATLQPTHVLVAQGNNAKQGGMYSCSSSTSARHGVRCCSDTSSPVARVFQGTMWTQTTEVSPFASDLTCSSVWAKSDGLPGGQNNTVWGDNCSLAATYTQATAMCSAVGARLCTQVELFAGCTANSGCGLNDELVWSSTPCQLQEQRVTHAFECVACDVGKYSSMAGAANCTTCPPGVAVAGYAGGRSLCACRPNISIPLVNADFETDGATILVHTYMFPTMWRGTQSTVLVPSGSQPWGGLLAPSGRLYAALQRQGSALQQMLCGLQPAAYYRLSFWLAQRPGYGENERITVSINGTAIWTSPTPLTAAFTQHFVPFYSGLLDPMLQFENNCTDPLEDCTVFLDDISLELQLDCAGVAGGHATVDQCGRCNADPSKHCVQDCAGTWGGHSVSDMCGGCSANASNSCDRYNLYVLSPATQGYVGSIAGSNSLFKNGVLQASLDAGQVWQGAVSSGDVFSAHGPIYGVTSSSTGTHVMVPAQLKGTAFSVYNYRSQPIDLYMQCLLEAACNITVSAQSAAGAAITRQVTVAAGVYVQLDDIDGGADTAMYVSSTAIMLLAVSGSSRDFMPIAPVAAEVYGIPSTQLGMSMPPAITGSTTATTGTTVLQLCSDSSSTTHQLQPASAPRLRTTGFSSQYSGKACRLSSTSPFGASAYADGDGWESTPFLPSHLFSTHFVAPVQYQWLAFASNQSGTVTVGSSILVLAGTSSAPGVYRAKSGSGSAGVLIQASVPVWAVIEVYSDQDENLMYGRFSGLD